VTKPTVSVIMPTYNQAEFLEAALVALDKQSFGDFELIVVNDGSTDHTEEILDAWRPSHPMIVIAQPNSGTAQAINAGISLARGRWWTWVSSDNTQERLWLERLLEAVKGTKAGAVFSDYYRDENGKVGPEKIPNDPRPGYKRGQLIETINCFFGPSFLIRSDVWRAAGPHTGKISHDYGHWLRVEEVCMINGMDILYVPEQLAVYRAHPKRVTVTHRHEFDAHDFQARAKERRDAKTGICLREVKA
jgi:glycosyltransferase involved in cell wall biosynthesis